MSAPAVEVSALTLHGAHGVTLYAERLQSAAATDGLGVVLVHGLASNARLWSGTALALARLGHPSLALDLRGHGRSEKPAAGYDFETFVADLAAVLAELAANDPSFERPVLAGQSLGGNLVLQFAAEHPEQIAGLVAVDGGVIDLPAHFGSWEQCWEKLAPPDLTSYTPRELEQLIRAHAAELPDAGVEAMLDCFAVTPAGTVTPHLSREHHRELLHALWDNPPGNIYRSLSRPVLLLPAGRDPAGFSSDRRADVDRALTAIPIARARWFANSGHDIHAERPDELAKTIHDAITDGYLS